MQAAQSTKAFGIFLLSCVTAIAPAQAQSIMAVCTPKILANQVVATPAQRASAGSMALPPITDLSNGFAWPDTPLGIVRGDGGGYLFFGSDGAFHAHQEFEGNPYGENRYGSVARTIGTLDKPIGPEPPIDATIRPNPDPAVNPFYSSYDYMGGGPVYKVPDGLFGAGKLLLVYHAEIPTITTNSFYSVLGLAASSNEGKTWIDLGEIIRVNQGYRSDIDGFDIGVSPLVLSPDGKYFSIFFPDWRANGTTHWGNSVTSVSTARAQVGPLLQAAFGERPHTLPFAKYYEGWSLEQGLGGYSKNLNTGTPYGGQLQVAYNADLHRYQMMTNAGDVVYYSESPDGLSWSPLSVLYDFRSDPDLPSVYVTFAGMGEDPAILHRNFYIFYTRYPGNGTGWPGASLNRFTVSCN